MNALLEVPKGSWSRFYNDFVVPCWENPIVFVVRVRRSLRRECEYWFDNTVQGEELCRVRSGNRVFRWSLFIAFCKRICIRGKYASKLGFDGTHDSENS